MAWVKGAIKPTCRQEWVWYYLVRAMYNYYRGDNFNSRTALANAIGYADGRLPIK